MRFNDHDGPVWRSLDAMCMYFELKKYKQGSTIFNRGDPGKKYCVVLGGSVEVVEEAAESNENEHVNEIDDMIDRLEDDRDLVDKVMESFPKDVQDNLNALSHKVAESGTFDDLDSDGNGVLTAAARCALGARRATSARELGEWSLHRCDASAAHAKRRGAA